MIRTTHKNNKILRQSLTNRIVHWTAALSIFLLIITGLGQMPLYKRYNVTNLPGAEWLGDYFTTLNLHYIGASIVIFITTFHIVNALIRKEFDIFPRKGDMKESYLIIKAMVTKGKEPPSDKYLAEQRVAYVFIGGSLLMLIITGFIKVYKNLPGVDLPESVLFWSTQLHNLGTVLIILGIIGHLAAFIVKENRTLLPGMFTGYIECDCVKHRHTIWYDKLVEGGEVIDEGYTPASAKDAERNPAVPKVPGNKQTHSK